MSLLELHETLRDRAEIELYLKPLDKSPSPIHIGSGGSELIKTIVRFPVKGKLLPIIPSESIKGVLRANAMGISKQLLWKGDVAIAVLAHTKKDSHDVANNPEFLKKAQDFVNENFTESQRNEIIDKASEIYASAICPICRLFGSRYLAGKLQITDSVPEGNPRILTYTSVAINRKTRTAEQNRLFTLEYLEPSQELAFKFTIIADNVEGNPEALLLAQLLEFLLRSGIRLGGAKSRGYGALKLDENRSSVKEVKFNIGQVGPQERLENVRRLLMKEGYYKKMSLHEYIQLLKAGYSLL
ncbi:MAG: RAMP superfamily CRISPR-associated protein [Nitrososphaerota archaeon]